MTFVVPQVSFLIFNQGYDLSFTLSAFSRPKPCLKNTNHTFAALSGYCRKTNSSKYEHFATHLRYFEKKNMM